MAVQVISYELRLARAQPPAILQAPEAPPATAEELENFYVHLEQVLTVGGFLNPDNPRHLMRRLRRLFLRAQPDKNEINILRGILAALDPERNGRRLQ
jgi:tRNA C32,U32 (ribose-2'-O)-methylase TrmJ